MTMWPYNITVITNWSQIYLQATTELSQSYHPLINWIKRFLVQLKQEHSGSGLIINALDNWMEPNSFCAWPLAIKGCNVPGMTTALYNQQWFTFATNKARNQYWSVINPQHITWLVRTDRNVTIKQSHLLSQHNPLYWTSNLSFPSLVMEPFNWSCDQFWPFHCPITALLENVTLLT